MFNKGISRQRIVKSLRHSGDCTHCVSVGFHIQTRQLMHCKLLIKEKDTCILVAIVSNHLQAANGCYFSNKHVS